MHVTLQFSILACHLFLLTSTMSLVGQSELPLFSMQEMQYLGAFRMPADVFGESSLNYSQGPIEYNAANHSLFVVGHSHHQAVAEFPIPDLIDSDLLNLEMSGSPLQAFSTVLDRTSGGNTQNIDRIGGMEVVTTSQGQELIVNAFEYYDAPADNTHSHLVIRDATDLANSNIEGYYAYNGGAGHTSGWISPVPLSWQSEVDGTHITGQSSGIPIIGRTSVGPSAFALDQGDLVVTTVNPTPTNRLLDFSLSNPLHSDLLNADGMNDIWTHLSQVTYGLIVPGTRTYLTVGHSGGHDSGVCYKCTQSDGNLCGGYCAPDADDYSQYYWLWDMNDLIEVKNGAKEAHDVRPYDYGPLNLPFTDGSHEIGGGTFDPNEGTMYLSLQRADTAQGTYSNPPIIIAFSLTQVVLPLQLITFEALMVNQEVYLIWRTRNEIDVAGFEIEMNTGQGWQTIGYMDSKVGGETSVYEYLWKLEEPLANSTSFRLKQLDLDGSYTLSPIEVVTPEDFEFFKIFPNPTTDQVDIHMAASQPSIIDITLYNTFGGEVFRQKQTSLTLSGIQMIQLDLESISPGAYMLRVNSHRKVFSKKIIIN